jgi:hypothetical protein
MSGPPTNIPPNELWAKLCAAERPSRVCDFPRLDEAGAPLGQIRLRILTQHEQMAAAIEADRFAKQFIKEGKRGDLGYERLFSDAYVIEQLFRACRTVEDSRHPFFPNAKDMREKLTTEECAMLLDHYQMAQVDLGPTALTMSEAEMDAWIERLKEGGAGFPFNTLSLDLQQLLLLRMAYLLRTSSKEDTYAGELPDSTTSSASETLESEQP